MWVFQEGDDDGRPDAEMAAQAWDNYRRRNDSVMVDHFQVGEHCMRCLTSGQCGLRDKS